MGQRGDTIVEVIFAFTIFSLVAVGGLSLMSRGAAIAQQSLEISLVRDQIDSQADALRYAHDAYIANYGHDAASKTVWNNIVATADSIAHPFKYMTDGQRCILPFDIAREGKPFALDISKMDGNGGSNPVLNFNPPEIPPIFVPVSDTTDLEDSTEFTMTTYAQLRYTDSRDVALLRAVSQGIWIQAVKERGSDNRPGYYDFHIRACWLSPGQSVPVTLGTIVRLYDPAV
jgi:type II secretory pathway pseudopilin PulG